VNPRARDPSPLPVVSMWGSPSAPFRAGASKRTKPSELSLTRGESGGGLSLHQVAMADDRGCVGCITFGHGRLVRALALALTQRRY
jgi:hypothetical protein